MLVKATFYNDEDLNKFFAENCDHNGDFKYYLVKFIVSFNPFERSREIHIVYSVNKMLKGAQHMRESGQKK